MAEKPTFWLLDDPPPEPQPPHVKFKFCCSLSKSIPKATQFELLSVEVNFSNFHFSVVNCYRLPSATKEAISSITDALLRLKFILIRDLNYDRLSSASDCIKELCNSLNVTQLIHTLSRLAFLHELYNCDISRVCLIDDVDCSWD